MICILEQKEWERIMESGEVEKETAIEYPQQNLQGDQSQPQEFWAEYIPDRVLPGQ